ncbi:HEAT repeat domain-containing protein [Natrarchaeobaculum aegyptiacum]|uniref:Phycocyanin alpha phycocyanobilin lyase n=1 Tax=Natrarchaeobaculum aegyptiacum TaxID=745377 RepID=A0A2Z2HW89_9EURY|nr:HEAT repeat domain-containing protein [Natrarchaeobaculum aegyptiacum]ARS91596.1 phycocyanin alpha phycocyanobilin lyase [Natrarchaeobaculum aegyptiacum]
MAADEPHFLYELARDGEELELLEYLTGSAKPLIRYRAAELLGGLPTPAESDSDHVVTRTLRRTVRQDDHDAVRAAAIDALYLRDEAALEEVIDEVAAAGIDDTPTWMDADRPTEWLASDHPEFRLVAAAAVGRIEDDSAIPALLEVLDDPDVRVRARATAACGAIGDPQCIDALVFRLEDSHEQVRRAGARALVAIGTPAAIDALAPAARSDSETVRAIAIDALGTAGSLDVVSLLVEGLSDRDEHVRRTATRSLLEVLANAPPQRSHEVRTAVAEAVADAEPPDLDTQLVTILGANQPAYVRRNGTWLLGQVVDADSDRTDDVHRRLIEALEDPDEVTARFATAALVELVDDATLARRLRTFREETNVDSAAERAGFVLEKRTRNRGPSREAVTNAVEYTVIEEPSDYTARKRERPLGGSDDGTAGPTDDGEDGDAGEGDGQDAWGETP